MPLAEDSEDTAVVKLKACRRCLPAIARRVFSLDFIDRSVQ